MEKEVFRSSILDQLRGLAIVLMIIFHCGYSLAMFKYADINFFEDTFWYALPRVIVSLFMFCVGMSLALTHTSSFKVKKFFVRVVKISLGAGIVSLVTYIIFPTKWIYFGTLHSIAICSIFALFFVRIPWVALFVGITLLLLSNIFGFDIPWPQLPHTSMDYISPFPWVGIVLLGIFAVKMNLHRVDIRALRGTRIMNLVSLLSKNSLIIYLIHQPIIIGLLFGFNYLMSLGE